MRHANPTAYRESESLAFRYACIIALVFASIGPAHAARVTIASIIGIGFAPAVPHSVRVIEMVWSPSAIRHDTLDVGRIGFWREASIRSDGEIEHKSVSLRSGSVPLGISSSSSIGSLNETHAVRTMLAADTLVRAAHTDTMPCSTVNVTDMHVAYVWVHYKADAAPTMIVIPLSGDCSEARADAYSELRQCILEHDSDW